SISKMTRQPSSGYRGMSSALSCNQWAENWLLETSISFLNPSSWNVSPQAQLQYLVLAFHVCVGMGRW
ncbi:hypothetical protein ACQP3D_30845, partial [Escherichia coli]